MGDVPQDEETPPGLMGQTPDPLHSDQERSYHFSFFQMGKHSPALFLPCWQGCGEAGTSAQQRWGAGWLSIYGEELASLWQTLCICLLTQESHCYRKELAYIHLINNSAWLPQHLNCLGAIFLFLAWLVDFTMTL